MFPVLGEVMKIITIIMLMVLLLSGCVSNDLVPKSKAKNKTPKNDITVTVNGTDVEMELSKSEWVVSYRCRSFDGINTGSTVFNILTDIYESDGFNSLLVFPDRSANVGKLYRNGLDWRFDWVDLDTENSFSIVIKTNGDGYYFNWSLSDENGQMKTEQTLTCNS
jgi:hypothetical protein